MKKILATRFCIPALALAIVSFPAGRTLATEEDFVIINRMPVAEGEVVRTVTRQEADTGITFTQTTYRQETTAFVIDTHVVQASCASPDRAPASAQPYIVAFKYQPRSPKAFAVAGLHDIFKDVYVRDKQDRVRAYENMGGRQMIELTQTFKPDCPEI